MGGGPQKKRSDLWEWKVPIRGATVVTYERRPGGNLYVRYLVVDQRSPRGRWVPLSLRHTDKGQAKAYARKLAAQLLEGEKPHLGEGELNVASLLQLYDEEVSAHKKGEQPREDARRRRLWEHYLGPTTPALDVDEDTLDRFCRDRRANKIEPKGVRLRPDPTDTTIGADIVYLQSVYRWAHRKKRVRVPGKPRKVPLLSSNPIEAYERVRTKNPVRRWATYDWYERARPFAGRIDEQGLLGHYLDLLEALGWRSTEVARLRRRSDVDRRATPSAPHGLLRHTGKNGLDEWVPMTAAIRATIDALTSRTLDLGDDLLFPAPRSDHAWSRHYIQKLLVRLSAAAGVPYVNAHAWRRKWDEEREGLPEQDVLVTQGRRDAKTRRESYLRRDHRRMLAVLEHPEKLRALDPGQLVLEQAG